MRSLQDAKQHGGPDRTDRGDLAEQFPRLVFLALRQQLPPHLLTHRPQRIELLVVKLGPPAHSRLSDLPEPRGSMARCIDLLAGTRNIHVTPSFRAKRGISLPFLSWVVPQVSDSHLGLPRLP